MSIYYSQALTVSGPKDDFDRFFDVFFTKHDSGQPAGIAIDRVAPAPDDILPEEVWNDDYIIDRVKDPSCCRSHRRLSCVRSR